MLRVTIGASIAALLFISASMTVEVFYVRDVVGAGGTGYALVFAGWTAGMILGAIRVAARLRAPLATAALVALAVQGSGLVAASLWAVLPWVIAGYFVGGVGHGVKNVLMRTLILQRVPAEAHGRAFATYNAARNTAELLALGLGGVLVGVMGAQSALLVAGLGPVVAALGALAYRPSSAAALSRRTAFATSSRQLEPVQLGQAGLGIEHRIVGPEAELVAQPARDLALDLVRQIAVLPAADVEVDVGLVQRHRHRLEVPRPADVREHDLHVRVPRGDPVEQDRPREVDPQPLPARLAGAEPARPGVRQDDQVQLGGRVEERQEPIVARDRSPASSGGASGPSGRARGTAASRSIASSRLGSTLPKPTKRSVVRADARDLRVVERLALRVPPEQHALEVQPLVERDEVLDRGRLGPGPEVALDRVGVMADAPTDPVAGGEVDVHVDGAHADGSCTGASDPHMLAY